MNILKKITSAVALVALLCGVFSTGVNAYSTAQVEAANYLAAEGIIVPHTDNPSAYNLDQPVLRQEIAAVARGIAGLDKATTYKGLFKDVTQARPNNWAWASVEPLRDAGLIAANENFNPERNISKAEAIGMVVKAAFDNEYAYDSSLSTTWQQQVVAFALANGVITSSFTNYNDNATRGFVFEAGANAKKVKSTDNTDDVCQVLLQLGLVDSCGTTPPDQSGTGSVVCSSTEHLENGKCVQNPSTGPITVGNGELGVSLSPQSPTSGTQIPMSGIVRVGKVDFTAGSSDVAINVATLKSVGLASMPLRTYVWFEKDGKRVSGRATFDSDRNAIVSFAPAYVVRAGQTITLDLYVELNTTSAGNDIQISGTVTDSSAAKVSGSFTTPALRTADYKITGVTIQSGGGSGTLYNQSEDVVELGSFRVTTNKPTGVTETRDVLFQNVTLRVQGLGSDLYNLSDLYLERNGQKVSTEVSTDGKDVTFVLNDTIRDGSTGLYYIKGKVSTVENDTDQYQFVLRKSTDLSVVESLNGFRVTVNDNTGTGSADNTQLGLYSIKGSDLRLARDNSVELSQTVAAGTQDVTLLKGTLTAKSAITLENPKINFSVDGQFNGTGMVANQLFSTVYLKIGSSTFSWSATDSTGGIAEFLGSAVVSGTADVRVYANLKDNANGATFTLSELRGGNFALAEYVSNQVSAKNSIVGSIAGVTLTVGTTGLNVARTDGLGTTNIISGSSDVLVNGVNMSINQGNSVRVSGATYTVNASGATAINGNAFATLYVNGNAVSTQTISNVAAVGSGTVRFTGFNQVVAKSAPVKLEVKVSFTEDFKTDDVFSMKLTEIDATDTVSSNPVDLGSNNPGAALFVFRNAVGSVLLSDNNPKTSLILAGSTNNPLLAFRVKATNDTIRLNDLAFSGAYVDTLSNYRLQLPSGAYVAASTVTSTGVVFSNLNLSETIKADNTVTYYLVADANSNTNQTGVVLDMNTGALNQFRGSNGKLLALDTSVGVKGNVHAIAENKAVVAKAGNSSKEITTSALRFTITASGRDSVVLTGADIGVQLSGYDSTGAVVSVYRTSATNSNLVGTGQIGGTLNIIGNNTTDAGNTNTFIIAVEGILPTSSSQNQGWTVKLNNLKIQAGNDTYNVSEYQNLGELPFTETK